MTREEFEALVYDIYNVKADYPFEDDFETGVFRHDSGKWFSIAMKVSDMQIDIVYLNCAPELIESLAGVELGIYRAYHMNKIHWLSVALDECEIDTLSWLLGISYDLTRSKIRKKR